MATLLKRLRGSFDHGLLIDARRCIHRGGARRSWPLSDGRCIGYPRSPTNEESTASHLLDTRIRLRLYP